MTIQERIEKLKKELEQLKSEVKEKPEKQCLGFVPRDGEEYYVLDMRGRIHYYCYSNNNTMVQNILEHTPVFRTEAEAIEERHRMCARVKLMQAEGIKRFESGKSNWTLYYNNIVKEFKSDMTKIFSCNSVYFHTEEQALAALKTLTKEEKEAYFQCKLEEE